MFKKFGAKLNEGVNKIQTSISSSSSSKDEVQAQIDKDKKELQEFEKKIKKVYEKFDKAGEEAKNQFEEHKKTLKYCSDLMDDSNNPFQQCINIFELGDEIAAKYHEKVQKKAMKPLKAYLEVIEALCKRVKILDERKSAMKKAEDKYKDMKKKPAEKQFGMNDLKVNYQNARDSWEYLRDELSKDVATVLKDIKENFGQICAVWMKKYSKYMLNMQEVWEKLREYAKELHAGDLEKEIRFTPTENSMVGEPNVQAKREKLISEGTYKKVE